MNISIVTSQIYFKVLACTFNIEKTIFLYPHLK